MSNNYLVRVRCMTYNHAAFIEDTMNGFCMQKTTFPFVCVIIDDASTDGEQKVIRNYLNHNFILGEEDICFWEETEDYVRCLARHNTNKNCFFVVVFLKYNHFSLRKSKDPYFKEWSNTKYVAHCEGDDYWIDPLKLQKQVDFLENNSDYGMCYGNIASVKDGIIANDPASSVQIDSVERVFLHNSIANMVTMSRNDLLIRYREEIEPSKRGWKMGDYPMWIWMVMESKIYHMDEVFGVYRILGESASHSQDYKKRLAFLDSTHDIRLFFANRYSLDENLISKINDVYYREKSIITRGHDKVAYRDALKRIKRKTAKEKIKYLLSFFGI